MIINIAGTSGSGKSHLMRTFLAWVKEHRGKVEEEFGEGRGAPIGYQIGLPKLRPIYVVGSYRTPTGGCDTMHDVQELFSAVREKYEAGFNILYEGLFVMNMTRGPQLAADVGRDFCVLHLTTPLATCMASINSRRAERGKGVLENKENTVSNYKRANSYTARMRDAGARVFKVSRDEGLDKILELLGLE